MKQALRRHGFPSQNALAETLGLSRATITSFFNGRAIDYTNFVEISERLGLDWQAIAYIEESFPVKTDILPHMPPNPSEGHHQNSINTYTNVKILENLVEALRQATQASEAALYTAQRTLDAMGHLIEELKQG
ncbi:MAG TPA: hypothetical protein DD990_34025 [Cyanobacteria bacterium UBA11368]|nr:hypothetical protein [Cyanobacteria bacterium UBA11368]